MSTSGATCALVSSVWHRDKTRRHSYRDEVQWRCSAIALVASEREYNHCSMLCLRGRAQGGEWGGPTTTTGGQTKGRERKKEINNRKSDKRAHVGFLFCCGLVCRLLGLGGLFPSTVSSHSLFVFFLPFSLSSASIHPLHYPHSILIHPPTFDFFLPFLPPSFLSIRRPPCSEHFHPVLCSPQLISALLASFTSTSFAPSRTELDSTPHISPNGIRPSDPLAARRHVPSPRSRLPPSRTGLCSRSRLRPQAPQGLLVLPALQSQESQVRPQRTMLEV